MVNKEKYIELLNGAFKVDMLPLYFVSLISSDTLLSADDCRKSIEQLTGIIEAIPETDIDDKGKWLDMAKKGLRIAKRDLKNFEKEEKNKRQDV